MQAFVISFLLVFSLILTPAVGLGAAPSDAAPLTSLASSKPGDWGVLVWGKNYPIYGAPIPINTDLKLAKTLKPYQKVFFSIDLTPGYEVDIALKALNLPMPGAVMQLLDKNKTVLRQIRIDPMRSMNRSPVYRPAYQGTYYVSIGTLQAALGTQDLLFKLSLREIEEEPLTKKRLNRDTAELISINTYPDNIIGATNRCNAFKFDALKNEIFQVGLKFEDPPPEAVSVSISDGQEQSIFTQSLAKPTDALSQNIKIPDYGTYYLDICLEEGDNELYPYSLELKLVSTPFKDKRR